MKTRKRRVPLKEILFVTAFKNIHRDQWKNASRSVEDYLKHFLVLSKLPYTLVVYVEPDIKKRIPLLPNILIRDFHEVDTFYNTFLKRDKQIMKSKSYQSKIPEKKKMNPEHLYSEYNLINHSKINFISHTKQLYPEYSFYSWVDFGFSGFNDIPRAISVSSLPKKIIYQILNKPIMISAEEMLAKDEVYFAGSAFIIHYSLVETFERKWKQKLIEWQKKGITDDDQSIVLQLYLDNPSMFHTVFSKKWRELYNLV